MSLLDKFDNIKITNDNRVTEDDLTFCKDLQEHYDIGLKFIKDTQKLFAEVTGIDVEGDIKYNQKSKNEFVDWYKWKDIKENESTINYNFTYKIVNYFNSTYSVSISETDIYKKYENTKLTYEIILDEIFEQLGGMNFNEKSINEIKENTITACRHKTKEIKNSKLILDGYFASYCGIFKRYEIKSTEELRQIFIGLYHIESGEVKKENELITRYCHWRCGEKEDKFDKYIPETLESVKYIKIFKNGKMEIEFTNNKQVTEFAKEYLGYVK